jgi:transposase
VLIGELTERCAAADARHEADLARLAALEALVGELAARQGRDSQNSSKPPGSDGPGSRAERRAAQKKARQDEREGGGPARKRGGQAGHRGGGLELTADPDVRMAPSEPAGCGGCGAGLDDALLAGRHRLQVIDIPEIAALVTEYLL